MNRFLDNTLALRRGFNIGGDDTHVVLEVTEAMTNTSDGFLHFSIPTTVAEEAAWWSLQEEHAIPLGLNASFLRPANMNWGPITGIGRVIRKGQGVMVAEGEAWQNGKLIYKVTVNFVRFEKR